ncbi:hypothetical protein Tco_0437036, partial [Tanacetum coccineum]
MMSSTSYRRNLPMIQEQNMADSEDSPSTNKDVVLVSAFVAEKTKDQKVTIPLKTSGKRKQTAPTPSTRTTRQKTQKHSTRGSKAASESSQ